MDSKNMQFLTRPETTSSIEAKIAEKFLKVQLYEIATTSTGKNKVIIDVVVSGRSDGEYKICNLIIFLI